MDMAPPALSSPRSQDRVLSIDVFRGLTMLLMIFANDLDMAGIEDVPWWMKHARAADFITFVDVIAPAFLFIVGAAIPLAVQRRLERGATYRQLWAHILIRTISLMVIGIYMGNMRVSDVLRNSDVHPIGMSHAMWSVLLLTSFILLWNDYPRVSGWRRGMFIGLRMLGAIALVCLALVYRQGDELAPMRLRWYVVGAIGWSYLLACIVYSAFRPRLAGMVACVALLIAFYIGDRSGALDGLDFLQGFRRHVSPSRFIAGNVTHSIVGLIVGCLFLSWSPAPTPGKRILWLVALAAGLFAGGFMLRPLYGLSRPINSPTCILYCSGYCCVAYALLYWLIDVWGIRAWAAFTLPAGRNALLPYFLSFMLHPLTLVLGIGGLNDYLDAGIVGIIRTLMVTLVLGVGITALLGRMHVRVRL